jgi:hypothetical protein
VLQELSPQWDETFTLGHGVDVTAMAFLHVEVRRGLGLERTAAAQCDRPAARSRLQVFDSDSLRWDDSLGSVLLPIASLRKHGRQDHGRHDGAAAGAHCAEARWHPLTAHTLYGSQLSPLDVPPRPRLPLRPAREGWAPPRNCSWGPRHVF